MNPRERLYKENQDRAKEELNKAIEKGLRYNQDKLPYHLVSPYAIKELVKVLEFGSKKYAPRNWEKGMKWEEQTLSSMLRHIEAWRTGEDKDPETGLNHMAHVLCNAMFLMHFISTGTGTDDRQVKEDTEWKQRAFTKEAQALRAEMNWKFTEGYQRLGPQSATSPTNEPTPEN